MIRAAGIVAAGLVLLGAGSAQALTLQQVGGGFEQPTYVTSDPGDAGRLFVVERKGKIKEVKDGAVSPFADISSLVSCCEGERGLLSIALAPDFDASGRLYVDYTGKEEPGELRVAELRASGSGAPASSLRKVLTIPHPGESNHNGGQIQFGPDGYLYIATGDGGGSDDVHHNAQSRENLLGKILRIDPRQSGVLPYSVPTGNPFAAEPAPSNTIWSYGLRNPFRFSFDRLDGDLTIGDVGQEKREEVDYAPAPLLGAGANYGWNCEEGLIAGPGDDPGCAESSPADFTAPVFDYPHTAVGGGVTACAIIGGYVVRDRSLGDLYGRYLYGDLCVGELRSLDLASPFASDRSEGLELTNLNSFGEDSCGRVYAVDGSGRVFRLTGPTPAACPSPTQPAAPQGPAITKPAAPTYIGIKPQRRRVERGKRALLTIWVSPCNGRKGQSVELRRNGHANGTRFLSRACTAHFNPKVRRGTTFAAATREGRGYLPGKSRRLTIKLSHRRR